jgi:hypothetical protein
MLLRMDVVEPLRNSNARTLAIAIRPRKKITATTATTTIAALLFDFCAGGTQPG